MISSQPPSPAPDQSGHGRGSASAKSRWARWREHLRTLSSDLSEFYHAPYRRTMARAARDEDDFFMLVVLGEALGLPNPMAYETAELWPLLLDDVHEWHQRAGLERSPFDQFGCC